MRGTSYTSFSVFGNGLSQGKKTPKKGMNTQKLIHRVKIHILHQMKPYVRVKTNWEPSYTGISKFGELG